MSAHRNTNLNPHNDDLYLTMRAWLVSQGIKEASLEGQDMFDLCGRVLHELEHPSLQAEANLDHLLGNLPSVDEDLDEILEEMVEDESGGHR